MKDAIRILFIGAIFFVFCLPLLLQLVAIVVDGVEHSVRHFRLPSLTDYQRKVLVQILVGVSEFYS